MRGSRLRLFCVAVLLAACSRDLTVPDQAKAGSLTGRVTFAVPGRGDRRPAVGAVVSLLGTANEVTTNPAGVFTLPDVDETHGLVYFRFDSDGDGAIDRQRMLELAEYGSGPHRAIDVGEVVLGENAAGVGKVLRADLGSARSGHRGTTVFVPEGPFSATTNDDGSFLLPALPPGPLQFFAFRAGYVSTSLGLIELRSGEEYRFRDVQLQLDTGPQTPGSVVGRLSFAPAAMGKGDSAVQLVGGPTGAVADDLGFRIDAVPPGLYVLTARRGGYTDATVPNVLVLPGVEAAVGAVLLTDRPVADAGALPLGDAGAAMDDGGVPDAGQPDAGGPTDAGTPCGSTSACGTGEWCDQGFSRPQCSATVSCSGGRVCDPASSTCVRPCSAGCSAGSMCHGPSALCRAECDLTFGCAAGFFCAAGLCLPECGPGRPACPTHQTCSAGACVPANTCDDDLDCPSHLMCRNARCDARPTAPGDAGTFTCTQPCHCRLGEWCSAGQCLPDGVPTLRLAADAGADLAAALVDAGPDAVLALRSDDVFYSNAPLRFAANRVTLAGGYVDCGASNRWVRADATRSTLVVDAGTAVYAEGVFDARVSNLVLQPHRVGAACEAPLVVRDAVRPSVRFIEGGLPPMTCGNGDQSLVLFERASEVVARDITLLRSGENAGWVRVLQFDNSFGVLRDIAVAPQPDLHFRLAVILARDMNGPLTISGTRLPQITAKDSVNGVGIETNGSTSSRPVVVEDSVLRWPIGTNGQNFTGIYFLNQLAATARNNVIDGRGNPGPHHARVTPITFDESAGVLSGNHVYAPNGAGTTGTSFVGLYIEGPRDAVTIADNVIVGGDSPGTFAGIEIANGDNGGPLTIQRNFIHDISGHRCTGLVVSNAGLSAGIRIADNDISVSGEGGCGGGPAMALNLHAATALVERNRFAATNAFQVVPVRVYGETNTELHANQLWAGPNTCSTAPSRGVYAEDCNQLYLGGNTIEAEGSLTMPGATEGVYCSNSGVIHATSNVIGGGSAPTHRMLAGGGAACWQPENFRNNYFWYRRATVGTDGQEQLFSVIDAGAGTFDGRGNLFNENVSPFDAVQPTRADGGTLHDFRLAAGSPAVDRGQLALRLRDGQRVTHDLFNLPRDAGTGPDIGCCERR